MAETFFIADTHFGHINALEFRSQFDTIEQHDEHIIDRWNRTVRPQDIVYHLGDVVMNRRCIPTVGRLNGHKRLVRGNHDLFNLKDWLPYFENVMGVRVFEKHGFVCSHIPLHPESVKRWGFNVHGHLHSNALEDPHYLCVSCEQVDYTPVALPDILATLERRK